MKNIHETFAVGRLCKTDRRVIVLSRSTPLPIRGPWVLRAIVSK